MVKYKVTVRDDGGEFYDKVIEASGWNIYYGGVLVLVGGELYGLLEAFAPGQWLHVERIAE